MSSAPDRFRSASRTLRTRVLVVGVFLGALIALTLSWTLSWNLDAAGPGGKADEPPPAKVAAFHSPPGSCLAWDRPDADDARKVPCEQPHKFEVTGVVDIAPQFPPGAQPPTLQQWRDLANQRCAEGATAYLGKKLDPHGRLSLGVLRPDKKQWDDGDRQLRCGLQWSAPGGELQVITGPAVGQDQSNIWEAGTCLALNGKTVGNPIDCAQPHAYEIIGVLDLKSKFSEYPSKDEQKAWLDTQCNKIADDYSGGQNLAEKKLILAWDLLEKESWEAGSVKVNCKVGAVLPDNTGLAPVTGSVRKAAPPPSTTPGAPAPTTSRTP